MQRNWQLIEAPFQPGKLGHHETIYTIGNGYVGVRGAFEETYPGQQPLFLIHGVFNQPAHLSVPELAPAPLWYAVSLTINGQTFSLADGTILGFERTLSLRHGVLRRAVLWSAPDGTICRLIFERFASMAREHVMVQRITVRAVNRPVALRLLLHWGPVDAAHWKNATVCYEQDGSMLLHAQTTQSGYGLGMAAAVDVPGAAQIQATDQGVQVAYALEVNQDAVVTRAVSVYTTRTTAEPLAAARDLLAEVAPHGFDGLLAEHRAAWDAIWRDADVIIRGDDYAQQAIRFAIYHLTIAAPRQDERVSIGAKTLSGTGYKGHVFWDTELFALVPFIYSQPAIARNLLMYRYHLIEGARRKAREEGFEGAMYPWESTDTGEETTPKWGDPHPVTGERERIWTGDREIHISADIAYGILLYWRVSGDDEFMTNYGAEVVLDTAVFWGSRVEYNAEHDRYELTGVIGPDEYHENVDNSVFTNWMARWHLQCALEVLAWLKAKHPQQAEALVRRLDLTPERLSHWQHVIDRMYIPRDGDVLVQFDGFFDLEHIDVQSYQPRVASLQAILGTRRVNASQIIKQADVVMLIALMQDAIGSPEMQRVNYDVYEPRCDHGSSLSAAMHSLVAARLGLVDEAYRYWMIAAGADLEDNKGNTADGIHAAAAGGLWQAVVLGFAGLKVEDGTPEVDPKLPAHWEELSFSVFVHGNRKVVTITPEQIAIT
ncbi:MAG: glycoside hydrolase family 65 protein [Anaerolineae bacterium]